MTNLQMWSLVAGFFLPPVLAVIQQSHWSNTLRALVAFAASLLVGAGTAYFSNDLTGKTFVQAALVVLVSAVATYHGLWKTSGIAPTIEAGTTKHPPAHHATRAHH